MRLLYAVAIRFTFPQTWSVIEPFYMGDRCAEVGWTWTQQVLGGIPPEPRYLFKSIPDYNRLQQWPTWGYREQDAGPPKTSATRSTLLLPIKSIGRFKWTMSTHCSGNPSGPP